MATVQAVRFRETTVEFLTVKINGIACLRWQDVQRRFPTASALCIDNRQVPFVCDDYGNDLEPLRIEAYPDKTIEAVEPTGKSSNTIKDRLESISLDLQDVRRTNQLILANTQETLVRLKHVMTQMYELQEYTTPRYFFILPAKHSDLAVANAVKDLFLFHFKLYFLCECSDKPNELHVAPHEGYSIKKSKEFISKYGPYLVTTLTVARAVLTISGFVIPQLGNVSTAVKVITPAFEKFDGMELTKKLDFAGQVLEEANIEFNRLDPRALETKDSPSAPLQGAQLRELEAYLETIDSKNSLGNLYRTTTDDGHVRWVCLEHYNSISHNRRMADYIRQFEAFGGKFNEKTNQGIITNITLTKTNIETLCDALINGFNISSLTFERCSLHEDILNKLLELIINRSSVRCLIMSNTTIKQGWIRTSEYLCGCISVQVYNKSLNVQFFERYQDGDTKFLMQLWSQNKVCRVLNISGGNLNGNAKDLCLLLKKSQEPMTLTIKYVNNIEFLFDLLSGKSPLDHLRLSFWSSSSAIFTRFCEILSKTSTLTELSIIDHHCFDAGPLTDRLLTALRANKSIGRLTLHVYRVAPSNQKEVCLINALSNDSFITRLHISESIISPAFVEALVLASQKPNSLTHLEFYDCEIHEEFISSLQMQHEFGNLTHLSFSKEKYWSVAIAEMRQQFQEGTMHYQNQKLEELIQQENSSKISLYQQGLTDRDMELIIRDAINNKQCKELYLASNKFTSIGISMLADALNNDNQVVESLWLFDNQVCDDGVYSLVKALSMNNKTLKKLDLGHCKITDSGVKHLAELLKTNQTLIHLYLNQNEITDHGVRILASAIENPHSSIETLHLSENKLLTDKCVEYLLAMIKQNQSLKVLRVFNCNLSEKGKERLNKAAIIKERLEIFPLNIVK